MANPNIRKKKVDARIRTLIENGIKLQHRTMFVIVGELLRTPRTAEIARKLNLCSGDRGREQVANLHYILSKSTVKSRPSVLWCYKKELGFTT